MTVDLQTIFPALGRRRSLWLVGWLTTSVIATVAPNAGAEPAVTAPAPGSTAAAAASASASGVPEVAPPPPQDMAPPPAPAAPTEPPAPAPVPVPPPLPAPSPVAPRLVLSPGEAVVHVAVNHRDAWLETRSYVDGGEFERTCQAPCDLRLRLEGREARVVAPGMTTSNVFRFDAGAGVAGVRVDGGSSSARRAGVVSLAAGIPIALAGMALFALGRVNDKPGLEGGGIAALALGGAGITVSLPLLVLGTTSVKNAKGSLIAVGPPRNASF